MALTILIVLTITSVLAWWLSGYDTRVTGEDKAADFRRRALRCGATLVLVALGFAGGFFFIGVTVLIAVLWAGCLSEIGARGFHSLLDSHDTTEFDPGKLSADLDRLAALVQQGRNEEAIRLCSTLLETKEGSRLAVETAIFRLYDQMFTGEQLLASASLLQVHRRCEEGRFVEAESLLNSLLEGEPANLAAAVMLMGLYARDLRRPDKAQALLQSFERRPGVPPCFVDYARQRVSDWLAPVSEGQKETEGIESLLVARRRAGEPMASICPQEASPAELLAAGHLGTAIEILEAKLTERPEDFGLWLQLAEAYGHYCGDLKRAGGIVARMEGKGAFSAEQVRVAKARLAEWRARQSPV